MHVFPSDSDSTPDRARRAFFIDSENGITTLIEGVEYLNEQDEVLVFHRNNLPEKVRLRLCMSAARVEWIACVDPNVKNSMDVQIIADMSARLQADLFDSGFIVSNDKGYLPALHYLQQTSRGEGHTLSQIPCIERAVYHDTFRLLDSIREANSKSELRWTLAATLGKKGAEKTMEGLSRLFAQPVPIKPIVVNGTAPSQDVPSESAALFEDALDGSLESQSSNESFKGVSGIGRALATKLKSVGIETPDQLKNVGALEAWERIYDADGSFSIKWIYSFEAAVQGIKPCLLNQKRKKELKQQAKQHVAA